MTAARSRVAVGVLWLTLAIWSDISVPATPAIAADRLITLQGVGPFKLGMSLDELKSLTHAKVTEIMSCGENPSSACSSARYVMTART